MGQVLAEKSQVEIQRYQHVGLGTSGFLGRDTD